MLKKLELAQLLQQRIAPDDDISYMTNNLGMAVDVAHRGGTLELSIIPLIVLPDNNKGVSIMDEETEVYTIYQRVTQIEKRHVTAPKGLTFNQLSDWVDENGVGDLLDIDELDNDMVSADYEDGSHVKRKWAN